MLHPLQLMPRVIIQNAMISSIKFSEEKLSQLDLSQKLMDLRIPSLMNGTYYGAMEIANHTSMKVLNEYQKINHFPNSNEITRKDKLCQNLVKMQEKYGKHHFDFIPETYVLPDEFGDFYSTFKSLRQLTSTRTFGQ